MRAHASRNPQTLAAFLLYLGFVVYGSLVPFEVRPLDWDQAVLGFRHIEYLDLGVVSRADWIANIVLYVPLAFLGCTALLGIDRRGWRAALGMPLVGVFCLAVAFGVEFAQQWFAPRTVSINDLIAESIGILIGLSLWGLGRGRIAWLWESFALGGRASLLAALIAYGLFYLALSLFPYDFVLSAQELKGRFDSDNQGWLAAASCGGPIRCGARLGLDGLAVLPFGVLAALLWPGLSLGRLFALGVLAGLVLEPLQLLIVSGTSQGLSVPLRGAGVALGGLLGARLRLAGSRPLAQALTLAAPILILPYLAGLALVSGWFASPAISPGAALAQLREVHWLPLYYHYFTTESVAMASALAQLALYTPMGLLAWGLSARPGARGSGAWLAAGLALALGAIVESGKLFFPPSHPDPTNLLVALTGTLLAYGLASWLERALSGGVHKEPKRRTGWDDEPLPDPATPRLAPAPTLSVPASGAPTTSEPDWTTAVPGPAQAALPPVAAAARAGSQARARPLWPAPTTLGVAMGTLAGVPLAIGTLAFPLAWPLAAAGLALYMLLLWFYPLAWLLVLPALLPALDLSPTTGRLPLDAFDLCVLATLSVGYARLWGRRPLPWPNRLFPLALALLCVSWASASARGLWPLLGSDWPPPDSSHSPLEAWTVGKGMLWALLLVPLLRRVPTRLLEEARALFVRGVLLGLALVALSVLWERHVFVGLTDFENDFRVTGTFASMHTGGAYIEAFLAFAFPFLAVAVIRARTWPGRGLGVLLAAAVGYSMTVTFSRGGWAGLAVGLLAVLAGTLGQRGAGRRGAWIAAAALVGAVGLASVPVLTGGFAQGRLAQSLTDLKIRVAHWQRALSLMTPGPRSVLTGEGFGQYPLAYLIQSGLDPGQRPPGTYAIMKEGANPFLRLGGGETVFLDQQVDIEPGRTYRLSARVRRPAGAGTLEIPICEKALLYSFKCERVRLAADGIGSGWQDLSSDFQSGRLGAGGRWPHPPVKLALPNASGFGALDLDAVSLKTQDGRELLANGDFSDGARHWLFVTDQDLAWHIHEQWVELYFAQGLLGVLALAVLLTAAGMALWSPFRAGDRLSVGLSAGLLGVLTVGLLGSVLDAAPLSMLFYLALLYPAGALPGKQRGSRRPGGSRSSQASHTVESRPLHPGASGLASGPDQPNRIIDR